MKINRLFETVLILLNKETTTAKELAERFGVSTRTIYRDIDILSTAGIPVYTNRGSGGGISLLENYALSRALITEHERDNLLLALRILQATKYPEIEVLLGKIGALFKNTTPSDWFRIELSPWDSGPNAENKLLDIKRAILECKVITFDYIDANGIRSRRNIEPMQLLFKYQAWYLNGYCRARRDIRAFRLSGIKNLVTTDEVYIPRPLQDIKEEESSAVSRKYVTLKLRFQPEDLYRIFDDYDEGRIIRNADGTYDVTITLPEDEWVYGYIMSFGYYIEVLEPIYIRDIVRESLKKTLELYQK